MSEFGVFCGRTHRVILSYAAALRRRMSLESWDKLRLSDDGDTVFHTSVNESDVSQQANVCLANVAIVDALLASPVAASYKEKLVHPLRLNSPQPSFFQPDDAGPPLLSSFSPRQLCGTRVASAGAKAGGASAARSASYSPPVTATDHFPSRPGSQPTGGTPPVPLIAVNYTDQSFVPVVAATAQRAAAGGAASARPHATLAAPAPAPSAITDAASFTLDGDTLYEGAGVALAPLGGMFLPRQPLHAMSVMPAPRPAVAAAAVAAFATAPAGDAEWNSGAADWLPDFGIGAASIAASAGAAVGADGAAGLSGGPYLSRHTFAVCASPAPPAAGAHPPAAASAAAAPTCAPPAAHAPGGVSTARGARVGGWPAAAAAAVSSFRSYGGAGSGGGLSAAAYVALMNSRGGTAALGLRSFNPELMRRGGGGLPLAPAAPAPAPVPAFEFSHDNSCAGASAGDVGDDDGSGGGGAAGDAGGGGGGGGGWHGQLRPVTAADLPWAAAQRRAAGVAALMAAVARGAFAAAPPAPATALAPAPPAFALSPQYPPAFTLDDSSHPLLLDEGEDAGGDLLARLLQLDGGGGGGGFDEWDAGSPGAGGGAPPGGAGGSPVVGGAGCPGATAIAAVAPAAGPATFGRLHAAPASARAGGPPAPAPVLFPRALLTLAVPRRPLDAVPRLAAAAVRPPSRPTSRRPARPPAALPSLPSLPSRLYAVRSCG